MYICFDQNIPHSPLHTPRDKDIYVAARHRDVRFSMGCCGSFSINGESLPSLRSENRASFCSPRFLLSLILIVGYHLSSQSTQQRSYHLDLHLLSRLYVSPKKNQKRSISPTNPNVCLASQIPKLRGASSNDGDSAGVSAGESARLGVESQTAPPMTATAAVADSSSPPQTPPREPRSSPRAPSPHFQKITNKAQEK